MIVTWMMISRSWERMGVGRTGTRKALRTSAVFRKNCEKEALHIICNVLRPFATIRMDYKDRKRNIVI